MKRIFFMGLFTAVFVVFGMGTSFAASALFNGVEDNGEFDDAVLQVQFAATELVSPTAGFSLPLHCNGNEVISVFDSGIVLRAGAFIGKGATIRFTLQNATFDVLGTGWDLRLFAWDPVQNIINVVSNGYSAGGPTQNYVEFDATTSEIDYNTIVGVLKCKVNTGSLGTPYNGWDIDPNFALVFDTDPAQVGGPHTLYATGGDVGVMCTVIGGGVMPPGAANAPLTTFQTYAHQMQVNPKSWWERGAIGIDTIDASRDANRRWFRHHQREADDAAFTLSNSVAGWDSVAVSDDVKSLTLVLSGDFSGIYDPQEDVELDFIDDEVWDPVAQTVTFTCNEEFIIRMPLWGFGPAHHFEMWVDGVTQLNTRAWYLSAIVEMENTSGGQTIQLEQAVIGEWQVNGKQFFLPLVRQTADDMNRTFIRFVNDNTRTAVVFCDVLTESGYVKSLPIGEIAAHQAAQYTAAQINAAMMALGFADGDNFATRWTLTTTDNDDIDNAGAKIYGSAWFNMNTGGVWGTRILTMYEDMESTQSVRIWMDEDRDRGRGFSSGTVRSK